MKTCDQCGTTIVITVHNRRYCSQKCNRHAFYARHIERLRTESREWARAHPKDHRVYLREWRKRNVAYVSSKNRRYYENNLAKFAVYRVSRRRLEHSSGPGVTPAEWAMVLGQWSGLCAYCGVGGFMHMDHAIPLSRGGLHAVENIVPACPTCNHRKATKTEDEYRQLRLRECA